MLHARCFPVSCTSILAMVLAFGSVPALAELPDSLMAVHGKIIALGDAVTDDNSKAADNVKACQALPDEFKASEGATPLQKAYVEAQVESCVAIVMNEGKFSDGTGDACAHYLTYAKKMAALAESISASPGMDVDFMAEVILQLEHAGDKSKLIGCTDDYAGFAPAIAAAREAARGATDLSFMNEILAATSAITPENARDATAICNGFGQRLVEKQGLSDVENSYYPALLEGCLATATEKGKFTDDYGGDACSHLEAYAESLHATIAIVAKRPGAFEAMIPDMQTNLETAIAHSADLNCPHDLSNILK